MINAFSCQKGTKNWYSQKDQWRIEIKLKRTKYSWTLLHQGNKVKSGDGLNNVIDTAAIALDMYNQIKTTKEKKSKP
ncbi:MAG: hypothetical protein HWN81_00515 [Candidatus Lokiarchaeota archaeon]|nr:hypothetical protein [Candidatus Lokiarchaeota archaeon]